MAIRITAWIWNVLTMAYVMYAVVALCGYTRHPMSFAFVLFNFILPVILAALFALPWVLLLIGQGQAYRIGWQWAISECTLISLPCLYAIISNIAHSSVLVMICLGLPTMLSCYVLIKNPAE